MSNEISAQFAAHDASASLSPAEQALLSLGLAAKALCSGLFVSSRSMDDILANTVQTEIAGEQIRFAVDEDAGTVAASLPGGLRRLAVMCGDQGAVLLPPGAGKVFFEATPVTSALPPASECDWPMGDRMAVADESQLRGWDVRALGRAADVAMNHPSNPRTAALLVAHGGRLVLERYGAGAHADMQLQSWSMAKTLTAFLAGRLIQQGALELDQRPPVPAWRRAGDPRQQITLRHLLQMSSGLDFTASWAPDYDNSRGHPDHSYMYSGGIDCFQLALSRPLAHPPGSLGAYKNGDTLILGFLVQQFAREQGVDYFGWPQRELFDPLGIRRLVLEPDPYGNLMTSGNNFGTGRDWVRLGLLLLNDGVAGGRRLLPAGFCDFLRQPAPGWAGRYWTESGPDGWTDSIYGGQLWLNRYPAQDAWPLPADACFMLGVGGQYTFVIPSMDLVIVRLGHVLGAVEGSRGCLPQVLQQILEARRA